jgi:hypothetical protein
MSYLAASNHGSRNLISIFYPTFLILKKENEAYEIALLSVCLCVPPNVTSQQLSKHVPAVTNTQATIEELLDAVFYMRSVSYQMLNM